MTTTRTYIKEWQQALQKEINHLKKFGGNRFLVQDGRLLSSEGPYHYYFDTNMPLGIPVGFHDQTGMGRHENKRTSPFL